MTNEYLLLTIIIIIIKKKLLYNNMEKLSWILQLFNYKGAKYCSLLKNSFHHNCPPQIIYKNVGVDWLLGAGGLQVLEVESSVHVVRGVGHLVGVSYHA
jgi:hypothetical protein